MNSWAIHKFDDATGPASSAHMQIIKWFNASWVCNAYCVCDGYFDAECMLWIYDIQLVASKSCSWPYNMRSLNAAMKSNVTENK